MDNKKVDWLKKTDYQKETHNVWRVPDHYKFFGNLVPHEQLI